MIKDRTFSLSGRKATLKSDVDHKAILVDATETPMECPQKTNKYYSGKKKRHTIKTQMLINPEIGEIIFWAFEKGKVHDFQLFKNSKTHLKPGVQLTAGSGYQGLRKLQANSVWPKKSTKIGPYRSKIENRTEISQKNVSLLST